MKRVIFYFDGFNLYNGLKTKCISAPEWKKYYWLDLVKFCQQFTSQNQNLVSVKYFSAPPLNIGKRGRQAAFLSANRILNPSVFRVFNGKYYKKNVFCKLCSGTFEQPEEKGTDVSISVQMLLDCFNDQVDKLVLVTADSDLIPALEAIKSQFPAKQIKIYFPPLRTSAELLNRFRPVVFLENNKDKFDAAVMPDTVTVGNNTYTIPATWKYPPVSPATISPATTP
jgi:uncharacterized LabA/DUF88 family protein